MELPRFAVTLIERISPITQLDKDTMLNKSMVDYDKAVDKAKKKKEETPDALDWKDKTFLFLDGGYGRMLLAMILPFATNWINGFLDPGDPEPDEIEGHE